MAIYDSAASQLEQLLHNKGVAGLGGKWVNRYAVDGLITSTQDVRLCPIGCDTETKRHNRAT